MLGFLPSFLRGVIAMFLLALNTLFWCVLLFAVALVKLVLPFPAVRARIDPVLNGIANEGAYSYYGYVPGYFAEEESEPTDVVKVT